jgi:hypothetical protein
MWPPVGRSAPRDRCAITSGNQEVRHTSPSRPATARSRSLERPACALRSAGGSASGTFA